MWLSVLMVVLTYDGNHVRIPNATVFKGVITNFSLNPERRFDFSIGVETDDLQNAVDIGLSEIEKLSFVLKEPAADGRVDAIGDSSITLWFGAWINQNKTSLVKARGEAIRKVKTAFENADIAMPEPIYRLRFDDQPDQLLTKSNQRRQNAKPNRNVSMTKSAMSHPM